MPGQKAHTQCTPVPASLLGFMTHDWCTLWPWPDSSTVKTHVCKQKPEISPWSVVHGTWSITLLTISLWLYGLHLIWGCEWTYVRGIEMHLIYHLYERSKILSYQEGYIFCSCERWLCNVNSLTPERMNYSPAFFICHMRQLCSRLSNLHEQHEASLEDTERALSGYSVWMWQCDGSLAY